MAVIEDISGFQIFSGSDIGQAHVVAHRMLDLGRPARGHRLLGDWLANRRGEGSEWVHIQWHMLVFELAVGDWQSARARFDTHILPGACEGDQAVTDAPSGLWRLALAARSTAELPWEDVAKRARARLERDRDPYLELHDLLALAGAGDARSITRWIDVQRWNRAPDDTLLGFARAFRALADGRPLDAATRFERVLPDIATLGGSRAQNELFHDIHRFAARAAWRVQVA